jgi:hypothetical protein
VRDLGIKPVNFQHWLTNNRLWLWWAIYIPLVAMILIVNKKQLFLPVDDLHNLILSPLYKIFNSALIIIIARIIVIAVGVVILMICLFFPYFRVSKEGVQWTKELGEELAQASGEIAGEEISGLVKEESFRWSLIYGWLKLEERKILEAQFLLRELLATIWEAFPKQKISLSLFSKEGKWGIYHPLLAKLVVIESNDMVVDDTTFGLKLQFGDETQLLLHVYSEPDGFSPIDEKFILILGEVFLLIIMKQHYRIEDLLAYFDRVPLTFTNVKV